MMNRSGAAHAVLRDTSHSVNGTPNMLLRNLGQTVDGRQLPLRRGKIQLRSEGAEVFYRNIEIRLMRGLPEV